MATSLQPSAGAAQRMSAAALMEGGLTITSTATPALNCTYALDLIHLQAMQAQTNAILLAGATPAFAGGGAAFGCPDKQNAVHSFDVAQWNNFAEAAANFVVQCFLYGNGTTTTAPSASATIA